MLPKSNYLFAPNSSQNCNRLLFAPAREVRAWMVCGSRGLGMENCYDIEWVRRNIKWAQKDGSSPAVLASGSAPGESGVAVTLYRFVGSKYCSHSSSHHAF